MTIVSLCHLKPCVRNASRQMSVIRGLCGGSSPQAAKTTDQDLANRLMYNYTDTLLCNSAFIVLAMHHAMHMHEGLEVQLHKALAGGKCSASGSDRLIRYRTDWRVSAPDSPI
jgi:hypothetical protein